jgi:Fe2+ or Zn2+ uptake regulation protein
MKKETLETTLKEAGYKLTKARLAVVEVILKLHDKPFSADMVFSLIEKSKKLSCDQVSVYRTLAVLEELGAIRNSDIFGDTKFYELSEEGHHHKHHITCKKCHKIDVVDFCLVESQEKLLSKLGYKDLSHRLELSGLCPRCAS